MSTAAAPTTAAAPATATAPATAFASEPERLVQTYADLIARLSYTYLGSTHDAQDICQTVFLKLLEHPRTFDSADHERAWIIRTAANLCKDQLRSSARRTSVPIEEASEPAGGEEPETRLLADARHTEVLAAISALPQAYREAIYLHYYEGYSIKQISRATSCTEAAVAQRLSRGRAQLRGLLKGDAS